MYEFEIKATYNCLEIKYNKIIWGHIEVIKRVYFLT